MIESEQGVHNLNGQMALVPGMPRLISLDFLVKTPLDGYINVKDSLSITPLTIKTK